MPEKIPLNRKELESHLEEQLSFLERSCNSYDEGFDAEAKRLAITIRILVHDYKTSHSLLGQLGEKGRKFLDSTFNLTPQNGVALHGGLVCPSSSGSYIAMLDELPPPAFKWVDFETWWNMPALVDSKQRELTRKTIILTAADQDGGAHVDPRLDQVYYELMKNSLGWSYGTDSGDRPIEGAHKATIRQIAHEVLKTLKPDYTKKIAIQNDKGNFILGGISISNKTPSLKVGRNEQCPCGSGKKFKKCCAF